MTMEIDALHAGQPMRNSLDPCETCAEYIALARRLEAAQKMADALVVCVSLMPSGLPGSMYANATEQARAALEAWEKTK